MQTKEEVLQACTVSGLAVRLPNVTLDRPLYEDVKKALNLIGGKWKGGKTQAFVFEQDPTELLQEVATGKKRNIQKEFQFFQTPDHLASKMVTLANIDQENHLILEPSAGRGAIVKEILYQYPQTLVHGFELMELNRQYLAEINDFILLGNDFLTDRQRYNTMFDRIIANPPFANNQDIDHIHAMYSCLKKGGRMVSVASTHWRTSKNKKESEFKEWLRNLNATIDNIPAGTFKESGTNIETCLIVIDK